MRRHISRARLTTERTLPSPSPSAQVDDRWRWLLWFAGGREGARRVNERTVSVQGPPLPRLEKRR